MGQYSSWYNDTRWRKRRLSQLAHHPLCVMCLAQEIYTAATVADHVQPHRGDRNKFWFGELQSLCAGCHSGDKKRLEDGLPLRGSDADGWPR